MIARTPAYEAAAQLGHDYPDRYYLHEEGTSWALVLVDSGHPVAWSTPMADVWGHGERNLP